MHKIFCFVLLLNAVSLNAIAQRIEWQKSLGGSGNDFANSIQQTTDGGFITAGKSMSTNGDVTGNHGSWDYWIVKLSGTGTLQWQKSLGGSSEDEAASIEQTSDGGYIVAGQSKSNNGDVYRSRRGPAVFTDFNCWVVKLSSTGNIQWQKSLGGSKDEYAYCIKQCSDGGYILSGSTDSNNGIVQGNHGNADGWIVKLNAAGALEWQKCLGGSRSDYIYAVSQTSDGGYIAAGGTDSKDGDAVGNKSTVGNSDYFIVKLNNTGNVLWTKCLGGTNNEHAGSIGQTGDGGYIVAGRSSSNDGDVSRHHGATGVLDFDYWIVKLNNVGNIQWQTSLGGSGNFDAPNSIKQTSDKGYIIAGASNSTDGNVTGNRGINYWIVKLDNNGILQWTKCLGGSAGEDAKSIQQTADGRFIIAGYSLSFNGDITNSRGSSDYWIVKLVPPVENVWMKDTPDDTGLEPDPATALQIMSASPDIWMRNTLDATLQYQHQHEDPVFGATSPDHWIYVKLRNEFNTETNGTLSIYYANVSSALRWPVAWHLLTTVLVKRFTAHTTKVAKFNWTTLPGIGRYALLVRWSAPNDPMTTIETFDINANVRGNNNIVWRNINIVPLF